MKTIVLLITTFVIVFSCSPSETLLDKSPGIQDVQLGNMVGAFKDRITYTDNFVGGTDETALHFITLKQQISKGCRGNANTVRVTTYQGKIMEISMNVWCPGIKEIFVNKFGEPTQSFGDNYAWSGIRNSMSIKNTGEHYGAGKPSYEIILVSDVIQKEFEKSRKGNL